VNFLVCQFQVHFNGLINFDTPDIFDDHRCQEDPSNRHNFIAPYWRHYDHGRVYAMEYIQGHSDAAKNLPKSALEQIAKDIVETVGKGHERKTRIPIKERSDITADRIKKVVMFTWMDMYSDEETVNSEVSQIENVK